MFDLEHSLRALAKRSKPAAISRPVWSLVFLNHKDKYVVFLPRLHFSLYLFLSTAVTVTGFIFLYLMEGNW